MTIVFMEISTSISRFDFKANSHFLAREIFLAKVSFKEENETCQNIKIQVIPGLNVLHHDNCVYFNLYFHFMIIR